jgi:hypothetical protein
MNEHTYTNPCPKTHARGTGFPRGDRTRSLKSSATRAFLLGAGIAASLQTMGRYENKADSIATVVKSGKRRTSSGSGCWSACTMNRPARGKRGHR